MPMQGVLGLGQGWQALEKRGPRKVGSGANLTAILL